MPRRRPGSGPRRSACRATSRRLSAPPGCRTSAGRPSELAEQLVGATDHLDAPRHGRVEARCPRCACASPTACRTPLYWTVTVPSRSADLRDGPLELRLGRGRRGRPRRGSQLVGARPEQETSFRPGRRSARCARSVAASSPPSGFPRRARGLVARDRRHPGQEVVDDAPARPRCTGRSRGALARACGPSSPRPRRPSRGRSRRSRVGGRQGRGLAGHSRPARGGR